ncbi:MAG TPA: tRNA lysidine(34) synthetase TilS [Terracidiphilus sp.]|nr:tRNA lysidine(34) synthetase TilS [Terracidiphilus sp.]
MHSSRPTLALDNSLLRPGLRLAVAVSGGADSVALLRALAEKRRELGLVLHAAHLHHGLRGAEADADLEFCRALAASHEIPFHSARVNTESESRTSSVKPAETIEEAARRLRYSWFRELLTQVPLDAVATAHTLDDQAETVLAKFLRGAWTEGLSGIHPILEFQEGRIVRPLLSTTRVEIETYLRALGQAWREDSSNRHLSFTRNRIRHELLPQLESWNPRLRQHLAQMAELARDEEAWWEAEVDGIASQLILPGRPVRGGGRAAADDVALDITRLAALAPALQRRLIRHAAEQLGASLDFGSTESLRKLALEGRAGQSHSSNGLFGERSHRELRFTAASAIPSANTGAASEYQIRVPGESAAPAFGVYVRIDSSAPPADLSPHPGRQAVLRPWRAGDRVRLRYSSGPRKVKEVLERLRVTGAGRAAWPVLELEGRIIWMQGVEVEPEPGIQVSTQPLS